MDKFLFQKKEIAQSPNSFSLDWGYVDFWLKKQNQFLIEKSGKLVLKSDFRHSFDWTNAHKEKYIENVIATLGSVDNVICWNGSDYWIGYKNNSSLILLDGYNRIQAVLDFLHGRIKPFGRHISEWWFENGNQVAIDEEFYVKKAASLPFYCKFEFKMFSYDDLRKVEELCKNVFDCWGNGR